MVFLEAILLLFNLLGLKISSMSVAKLKKNSQSHSGHHNEKAWPQTDLAASLTFCSINWMQEVRAKGHW